MVVKCILESYFLKNQKNKVKEDPPPPILKPEMVLKVLYINHNYVWVWRKKKFLEKLISVSVVAPRKLDTKI